MKLSKLALLAIVCLSLSACYTGDADRADKMNDYSNLFGFLSLVMGAFAIFAFKLKPKSYAVVMFLSTGACSWGTWMASTSYGAESRYYACKAVIGGEVGADTEMRDECTKLLAAWDLDQARETADRQSRLTQTVQNIVK